MIKNHKPLSLEEVLSKLMRFCSYQERSEFEVLQKAKEFGLELSKAELLLDQLQEDNFQNEMRFAEAFIRGKVVVKRWGVYKLKEGLFKKGVRVKVIEESIKKIDQKIYLNNLKFLAKAKTTTMKGSNEEKVKVYRYLLSKGYESDLILKELN